MSAALMEEERHVGRLDADRGVERHFELARRVLEPRPQSVDAARSERRVQRAHQRLVFVGQHLEHSARLLGADEDELALEGGLEEVSHVGEAVELRASHVARTGRLRPAVQPRRLAQYLTDTVSGSCCPRQRVQRLRPRSQHHVTAARHQLLEGQQLRVDTETDEACKAKPKPY